MATVLAHFFSIRFHFRVLLQLLLCSRISAENYGIYFMTLNWKHISLFWTDLKILTVFQREHVVLMIYMPTDQSSGPMAEWISLTTRNLKASGSIPGLSFFLPFVFFLLVVIAFYWQISMPVLCHLYFGLFWQLKIAQKSHTLLYGWPTLCEYYICINFISIL